MQDVYWHICIHAADYNSGRGTPGAWIHMITRSRAIDSLRTSRKNVITAQLDETICPTAIGDPEARHREKWRKRFVHQIVANLPFGHREVVQLAFFQGFSHTDIACRTGLPLGTVKSRLRKALFHLRQASPPVSDAIW